MNRPESTGVPTSSGIPAIIIACVLGVPAAMFFCFSAGWLAGLDGTGSDLTLPRGALTGACLGASVGAWLALLCGFYLRPGFCYLFGSAFGAIACLVVSQAFFSKRNDEQQLLKDAIAMSLIVLGILGGAAVRIFVTRFGAKARKSAWLSAVICAGAVVPIVAFLVFGEYKAEAFANDPGTVLLEISAGTLIWVLIPAVFVGWIGALLGATREEDLSHRGHREHGEKSK
jgi:hypothetical protein